MSHAATSFGASADMYRVRHLSLLLMLAALVPNEELERTASRLTGLEERIPRYFDEVRQHSERWMRLRFTPNNQIIMWVLNAYAHKRIEITGTNDRKQVMMMPEAVAAILTAVARNELPEAKEVKSVEIFLRFHDEDATHELEGLLQGNHHSIRNLFVRPTLPYRGGDVPVRIEDARFA